ncbi:hypothetical protein EDC04DRAFT_2658077 [Pisolithus marmoratus]|nr:hypothetical protein EDC04DRAFT_2658077 [Pisolithus marmoratus]
MPVLDAAVKTATDELASGSVQAVSTLSLMVLRDKCSFVQFNRITAALYEVFDSVHLQRAKEENGKDHSVYPTLQVMTLRSLSCIVPEGALQDAQAEETCSVLLNHWPSIREWIMYLKRDFVDRSCIDITFRVRTKRSIVDFIGLIQHTDLRSIVPIISLSPGVLDTLLSLWRLEVEDRHFSCCGDSKDEMPPVYCTPGILDCWQAMFVNTENWSWDDLIIPFNNDGALLASTALAHLRHDIAQIPMDYDRVICDIHLMTTFSIKESVCMPMLKQGSLLTVVSLIFSLVRSEHPPDASPLVAKALSYACWYIRSYVEVGDGLTWITQVIKARLMEALLLIEPWITFLPDPDDWEPLHQLCGEIIPKYSLHRSVLELLAKTHKDIGAIGFPEKMEKDTPLWDAWMDFDGAVRSRLPLLTKDDTINYSCQNMKCGRRQPAAEFKQCTGCLQVYYCSKECQSFDWKLGGHRNYCNIIQKRRAYGAITHISSKDHRLFDAIILRDFAWLRPRVQELVIANPGILIAIHSDYTEWPSSHTIEPVSEAAEPPTCGCDMVLHAKWCDMIELARKSTSPRVLIRSFIPCGVFPKVMLQVRPIELVSLDDGRISSADTGNTFQHLYECSNVGLSFMDSAFPDVNKKERELLRVGGTPNTPALMCSSHPA